MSTLNRTHASDLRGAARLAIEATTGVVNVVERMHRTIQSVPGPLGKAPAGRTRGITGLVYRSIRGTTRLVGQGIDVALDALAGLLPAGDAHPRRDALVAALNGVHGDYLARTGNPLAIEMSLRRVDTRPPTGKLLVLVHGLCMNELQWRRDGHDHGAALADALGCTPLYLRYNSGLRIGENGQAMAALLESLVAGWPAPVKELAIVGHSMGGLVARSACFYASEQHRAWPKHLKKVVFLGTPHHGSPLERGGRWLDQVLALSPYSAPLTRLGQARSAGIQDLRYGTVTLDSRAFVPLPPGPQYFAAAATLAARRSMLADRLVGDGLVPLDSALGHHRNPARALGIPKTQQWIGYRMGHIDLLSHPEAYAQLRKWLDPCR